MVEKTQNLEEPRGQATAPPGGKAKHCNSGWPSRETQHGNKDPHPAHLEGPRICLFPETSKGALDSEGVGGLLGSGQVASHSSEEGLTGLSTFRANLISLCSF